MNKYLSFFTVACLCTFATICAKDYSVSSPNGKITVNVNDDNGIKWSVNYQGEPVIAPSAISLSLSDGTQLGAKAKVKKVQTSNVNKNFPTPFYKKSSVDERYNQLSLKLSDSLGLEFRAYDDAAAYRMVTDRKGEMTIVDELAEFNFPSDYKAFIPYINDNRGGDPWSYSFESYYDEQKLSQMFPDSMAITPLMVDLGQGRKAVIMEGGLEAYPGMFLKKNAATPNGLVGTFAAPITDGYWGGHMKLNYVSTERAPYIAKTEGARTFPWRTVVITEKDADLLGNDMAQLLAPECRIADTSWIKPGLVSWDWWNTTNLSGVDFKAGMNTDTYRYFIDFASANSIPYIIIDCGWSSGKADDWKEESLMICTPDIDLDSLIEYGKEKGIGIILWASWATANAEKETVFPYYAQKGIKGFKIDFLDRDDQDMIQSMWDIAKCAADNQLLLDFHGIKPSGIQRAYPNIVNFEGVKGLENTKWAPMDGDMSVTDFLRYDVTIPYTRMMAGPLDYTPGAMNNAAQHYFRPINDHPMSQGTRVHQMAMYTIYDAPLQMLADSPTAYMKNQECTDFIAAIPTTFDETVPLSGETGEYVALARRKGDTWYIAAMTNWQPRDMVIDLSFLPAGQYQAVIFSDGVNADSEGTDYRRQEATVTYGDKLNIHLAPGGGWTALLK